MNADLKKDLQDKTEDFIAKIRGNLAATGTDATLESSKSIHYELTESGRVGVTIEVKAKPFFAVVETGRKPTPDKKPGRDMIDNLLKWVQARSKPDNLVWAIAVSIMKKGSKLWQKGGRTDIYTDLKEPFVKEIADTVTRNLADEMADKITVGWQ